MAEGRTKLARSSLRMNSWADRAIARTTPGLLGRFSLVTLLACVLHPAALPTRYAAWYPTTDASFADALAAVRRHLWASHNNAPSAAAPEHPSFPARGGTPCTRPLATPPD